MWERSPTARLLWGIALTGLIGFGAVAISTGSLVWIAVALLVGAVALAQVLMAGPKRGRLWDSPLTKLLYCYLALWGIYLFGDAALDTGAAWAIVPLVVLIALIAAQWASVLLDRRSAT